MRVIFAKDLFRSPAVSVLQTKRTVLIRICDKFKKNAHQAIKHELGNKAFQLNLDEIHKFLLKRLIKHVSFSRKGKYFFVK